MKRTLAILLALILVFALAGCSQGSGSGSAAGSQNAGNQNAMQNNSPKAGNNASSKENTSKKENTPTDSNDISREEAISIALRHANVSKADAKGLKAEKDLDERTPRYDVSFHADGYEYDYEIAAATGKIIKSEKERAD